MTLLYTKRLFSLDVLDTRFTKSSWSQSTTSGPAKSAQVDPAKPLPGLDNHNETSGRSTQSKGRDDIHPSRLASPEFVLYYIVIGVALILMLKSVYDVSKCERFHSQLKRKLGKDPMREGKS